MPHFWCGVMNEHDLEFAVAAFSSTCDGAGVDWWSIDREAFASPGTSDGLVKLLAAGQSSPGMSSWTLV
jgi:hypothetical protein